MNKNVNLIKSKWNMTKNYFTAGRNWMKLSEILLIITLMVSLYKAPQKYTLVIYMLFHLIFASTGKQRSSLTEETIQSTHDLIHDK